MSDRTDGKNKKDALKKKVLKKRTCRGGTPISMDVRCVNSRSCTHYLWGNPEPGPVKLPSWLFFLRAERAGYQGSGVRPRVAVEPDFLSLGGGHLRAEAAGSKLRPACGDAGEPNWLYIGTYFTT